MGVQPAISADSNELGKVIEKGSITRIEAYFVLAGEPSVVCLGECRNTVAVRVVGSVLMRRAVNRMTLQNSRSHTACLREPLSQQAAVQLPSPTSRHSRPHLCSKLLSQRQGSDVRSQKGSWTPGRLHGSCERLQFHPVSEARCRAGPGRAEVFAPRELRPSHPRQHKYPVVPTYFATWRGGSAERVRSLLRSEPEWRICPSNRP